MITKEVDSITSNAIIEAKDIKSGMSAKNFLSQSTRRQIKETIGYAQTNGKKAIFWFSNEIDPAIAKYIAERGGVVKVGLGCP